MPTYDLVCDACGAATEHFQSMNDQSPLPTTCLVCGAEAVRQDYSGGLMARVMGNTNTVGALADANRKKMGEEQFKMTEEQLCPSRGETPWWREKDSKPLDLNKVSDVNRYIETGVK